MNQIVVDSMFGGHEKGVQLSYYDSGGDHDGIHLRLLSRIRYGRKSKSNEAVHGGNGKPRNGWLATGH